MVLMALVAFSYSAIAKAENNDDEHILFKAHAPTRNTRGGKKDAAAARGNPSTAAEAAPTTAPTRVDLREFHSDMNELCKRISDNIDHARRVVTTMDFIFCLAHKFLHKRNYGSTWDSGGSRIMGYYRGVMTPPYQMSVEQYLAIATTIMEIPHKPRRDKGNTPDLFASYTGQNLANATPGSPAALTEAIHRIHVPRPKTTNFRGPFHNETVQDGVSNLRRGDEGPRVLFWGCGADAIMWQHLLDYLGGSIVFVDDNEKWAKKCREGGARELIIVKHSGLKMQHKKAMRDLAHDGSNSTNANASDAVFLRDKTFIPLPASVAGNDTAPFDVIVVDGPAGHKYGRSQSLYTAVRLAQSYARVHYTHVFFHDAARPTSIDLANKLLGHDPATFVGNILPRKGLKHWRLPGQMRPLPSSIPARDD